MPSTHSTNHICMHGTSLELGCYAISGTIHQPQPLFSVHSDVAVSGAPIAQSGKVLWNTAWHNLMQL